MTSEKNVRVLVTTNGGPEVLKLVEEDLPEPQAGQVRVRVLAAGVGLLMSTFQFRQIGARPSDSHFWTNNGSWEGRDYMVKVES